LFARLLPLKSRCKIIFVDGGSSDGTPTLIEERGGIVIHSRKGRANQMNCGAKAANGEVLWFLHADSIPPANAVLLIMDVLNSGHEIGCFRLRFAGKHPLMFANALLSNLRVCLRGIAFGDQGIFLKKTLFEKLGGYAEIPLMEDYRLSLDARNAGYSIGMAKGSIVTSARRYVENGILKTALRMQVLQHRFRRGDDTEEIAKDYELMK